VSNISAYRYEQFANSYLDPTMRSGKQWRMRCMFHGSNSSTMSFNVDTGLYYCFSCHAAGNVIAIARELGLIVIGDNYIAELDDPVADVDALLNTISNLSDDLDEDLDEPEYPRENWLQRFRGNLSYWVGTNGATDELEKQRGLAPETAAAWQLGYDAINEQATIPVRLYEGNQLVGVIRRQTVRDVFPKYLNPKGFEKAKNLFGSWMYDRERGQSNHIVLVEGPVDALAVWQAGYNVGAILGSKLSRDQVRILLLMGIESVTLFCDNDKAGFKAMLSAIGMLKRKFVVSVADYDFGGDNDDPGSMTDEQIVECVDRAIELH
jgi:DNA primase